MPLHLSLPQAPEGEPPRSELPPSKCPGGSPRCRRTTRSAPGA